MLCSLVKQETLNFNNFISTKYIALYFTNVLGGIFVELHDKIILNIISNACVVIYSGKNQNLLRPRMRALSVCLDYWVWQENKATIVVALLPVFSLQQEMHYGITSKNMGQQGVGVCGCGCVLVLPLVQCFLHAELSLDLGQHGPGWPAVPNRHVYAKVSCIQWIISGPTFVGWKCNVWHHAEVIWTIWWVK